MGRMADEISREIGRKVGTLEDVLANLWKLFVNELQTEINRITYREGGKESVFIWRVPGYNEIYKFPDLNEWYCAIKNRDDPQIPDLALVFPFAKVAFCRKREELVDGCGNDLILSSVSEILTRRGYRITEKNGDLRADDITKEV